MRVFISFCPQPENKSQDFLCSFLDLLNYRLEEISDTYVFLRYSHERKAVVGNWDGLSTISTAMMKVSREVVEKISS